MTRLVLVVPTFPQLSETFIATKALGLLDRGWDVRIVATTSTDVAWKAFGPNHPVSRLRARTTVLAAPGSTVVSRVRSAGRGALAAASDSGRAMHHLRATVHHHGVGRLPRALVEVPIASLDPDILHVEFGALAPDLLHLKDVLGSRFTTSFRGYDISYVGLDRPGYYDELWARVDGVHVLGHDLWDRALARGAPADLAHRFISPAIDTKRFVARGPEHRWSGPIGTPHRPARLLSVGRLHWKKGYDYGLEAVAELRRRGASVEYRIIGTGGALEAVSFWRHQLGLDDCVELLGALPPDGVVAELHRADILLHPAVSEGFGNAPLEAQSTGLPVVCSDAEGLPENVAHEGTGLVVPRRDAGALADGLARLIGDDELRRSFSRAGPERVRAHFDLPQHLDAWDAFYGDLLEGRL